MFNIDGNIWQGAYPIKLPYEIQGIVSLISFDKNKYDDRKAYIRLPIPDGPPVSLNWLKMAVNITNELVEQFPVYIHCRAGISRSAALTAALLMKRNHWNYDKALNFIAEKNPKINPNKHFMNLLKELS